MLRILKFFSRLQLLLLCSTLAHAQWATQSITLNPGWNAVFLQIQPQPTDCDNLFAGLPIESVWGWNGRFSTVQYIQDPNNLIPGQPSWLTYLPPSSTNRAVNSLFHLLAEHAYLIRVSTNAPPFTWTIQGQPAPRGFSWVPDSFNLAGFHVDPLSPPTFQNYFAGSRAQSAGQMFRLNSTTGKWVPISPSVDQLTPGTAYWIQSTGPSSYPGPISLVFQQGHGMDFSRSLQELTFTIKNNSPTARMVTITKLPSASPPGSIFPALAGDVPLSYYRAVFPTNFGFVKLTDPISNTIPAGGSWALRLAVRRPDMAPSSDPQAQYQSLLQVSDSAGTRWLAPVTAYGFGAFVSAGTRARARAPVGPGKDSPTTNPYVGLWVGNAVIDHVSEPANPTNSVTPTPTASQLQLRVLLHLDESGQAWLLPKALLMWTNGTYMTNAAGVRIVEQPGRYVLVSDDTLASQFLGSAQRDGQLVAKRLSTTAYVLPGPALLTATGQFGADNSTFTCTNILSYTNLLNPFVHQYHPDHDNWDDSHITTFPEGIESFTITREIIFQFTALDPLNLGLSGWGDNQLGGIYIETVRGLHNSPLYVQGTFRLQQATRIGVLNDGLDASP